MFENNLLTTTLLGFLVGLGGIGLGGFIVILFRRPKGSMLSGMLGLAGGIMLAIICFELIPEAVRCGNQFSMFIGFFIGVGLMALADRIVSHLHMTEREDGMDMHQRKMQRMGLLLTIGIAFHVFPEGLAIGAGLACSTKFGIMIALLMAFQNIPEGVALATPNHAGGHPRRQTIFYGLMAGAPMGVGAFVGYLVGGVSPVFLSIALGFAGGAMFYITCDELIPTCHVESKQYGHLPIMSIVSGFVIGLSVIGFI